MYSKRTFAWLRKLGLPVAVATLALGSGEARAQEEADTVSPTGKGIAGGILLGAEVVMLAEAIAGVNAIWPYPVFGAIGAAGGGVGGYFVEDVGSSEGAVYMLVGGLALVIPTIIATLNATAYRPEDDVGEDEYTIEVEKVEPGEEPSPGGQPAPPAGGVEGSVELSSSRRYLPPAFFGVDRSGLRLGVPAVQIRHTYTAEEVSKFGVEQSAEVQVPLLFGTF